MALSASFLTPSLTELGKSIASNVQHQLSDQPLISVIIPCFNAEDLIYPCLESLKCQTLPLPMFEIICVDDCSTDSTSSILEKYKSELENLTVIRHQENKKQGGSRNTGMQHARGKYIIFIDCDDFFRMDALETFLFNSRDGSDVVVSQLLKVRYDKPYRSNQATRRIDGTVEASTLRNSLGWFPCSMLMDRKLLEENNITFQENIFFEDIEFCIKVFLSCKKCTVLKDQLYYYIQRDNSTVNFMTEKKLTDSAVAMASVFRLIQNRQDLLEIFKQTAISWLRLQSSRVRDNVPTKEQRYALGDHFMEELEAAKVFDYIGEEMEKEFRAITRGDPRTPAAQTQESSAITSSSPWGGKNEALFSGKIVFFCEVDYHIRSAAPVIRELNKMGLATLLVNASKSTSFSTNRPMSDSELNSYSDINIIDFNVAENLPFSTEATAFVFMNDLTYTNRLIFENFGFGIPTFGFYEGINDDWNLDRISPRKPYRSTDYLLLPGIYQKGFYSDRNCRVVGLPNVRSRFKDSYTPPKKKRAIINVNFTYGVLEDRRDTYVKTAVQACDELGLDYVITQHPADKADLSDYNVSDQSIYDLLLDGSILISRFSTTILEALAMGRPAVYHNPINERVPKFYEPLGAYSTSDSIVTLKEGLHKELQFVENGGDIRKRANLFLHFHCNIGEQQEPHVLAAQEITKVLATPQTRLNFKRGGDVFLQSEVVWSQADISIPASQQFTSIINIASSLLLDPIGTLPRVEKDGDLSAQVNAVIKAGGPAAEHLIKVRDWARKRVSANSNAETQEKAG